VSSGISVRQMRSRTRQVIAGYRMARRVTGLAMRHALLHHRAKVISGLRAAFTGVNAAADTAPPPAAVPYAERCSVWELCPEPRDDRDSRDRSDDLLQVVHVVQNHPEGICARDIGNELGTDWRKILGLTRRLVEAGLVDQVDEAYYPIAKAGR
jgi:hypothetical protein